MISSEFPEFKVLAELADIHPSRLEAALADLPHFFAHVSLDELKRLNESSVRLSIISRQIAHALEGYATYAREHQSQS